MLAGAAFGVAVADSVFGFLALFGLGGASGFASDLRGRPRRRGVFSAAGSDPCAFIGPLLGSGAAGWCTAGAGAALLRFLGGAFSSSSWSCVSISVPPIVDGVEGGAGRWCWSTGCCGCA